MACSKSTAMANRLWSSMCASEEHRWHSGVRGTSDFHLRQAIQQQPRPGGEVCSLIDAVLLDTEQLAEDAWRVEVWYAHHGFFDARFQGWELRPLAWHGDGSPKEVEVVGHVREGRPSTVRDILLLGIEGMGTYSQRLLRRASVEEENVFRSTIIRARCRTCSRSTCGSRLCPCTCGRQRGCLSGLGGGGCHL